MGWIPVHRDSRVMQGTQKQAGMGNHPPFPTSAATLAALGLIELEGNPSGSGRADYGIEEGSAS